MPMIELLFIPGSLRQASSSRATVRALIKRVEDSATCVTADPGLLPHYNADILDDPAVKAFIDQIAHANGLVFVTPEYNYSVPGVLKNAIDWASRPAMKSVFKDKHCFVMSVSGGALGGVRAQGHLKYSLNGMLAKVFACPEIVVPMANDKVENGLLTDERILTFAEEQLRAFMTTLSESVPDIR
ncbi:chromate reductase [Rhizobium petrolearium]|uniref:NADPH-dependent FMN reductase n=1 Tax=Neorhizobium petrolearium TaxID=515361 RepID=UPI001F416FB5|nr:NADPH-dependent FMN reductase [Neorhizobium petrolearium]MBP1845770.1 chromate reductase [Neorhizobium petrolearium]